MQKVKRFVEVGSPTLNSSHVDGFMPNHNETNACKMFVEMGSSTSLNLKFEHGTHEGGTSRKERKGLYP